jgi:hypothetical protein
MNQIDIINQFFKGDNLEFDFLKEKKSLVENLNWLKSLSVEEFTFYKKWEEIQICKEMHNRATKVKSLIWTPTDINDEKLTIQEIENLNPKVVPVSIDNPDWTILRTFCHTAEFNQSPGRYMKFIVTDGNDSTFGELPHYLGFIAIASDVITIKDRDSWIGWTHDNRIKDKRLDYSAIGTCVAPTQPFGFNFNGGKLISALTVSKTVRDRWKELYDTLMVGMTVTSLYGSFSQYTNLKWWKDCGKSTGKILLKPDERHYKIWHEWIKKNRTADYEKTMTQKEGISGPVTSAKLRVLSMIFDAVDIKLKNYVHGHERGVYYSMFYENGKEFFQNKIKEDQLKLKQLYQKDMDAIMEYWKPRAIDRYKKLKAEDRIKPDVLFYSDMIDMPYEDAKKRFLKEVGR